MTHLRWPSGKKLIYFVFVFLVLVCGKKRTTFFRVGMGVFRQKSGRFSVDTPIDDDLT